MNLPAILKEEVLSNLDFSLSKLFYNKSLGLFLSTKIVRNHIPISFILNSLNECDGVGIEIIDVKDFKFNSEDHSCIIFSDSGDSYIIEKKHNSFF